MAAYNAQAPAGLMQTGATITAANGAGNRAITGYFPGGMGGLIATMSAPAGTRVLKVFDQVTGADFTADYASSLNATNQIAQLSGNHAANSPMAILLVPV